MEPRTKTCGRILRLSIVAFLALITASCATAGHKELKIKHSLKTLAEAFNGDIRWQDYQSAEAFIPKDRKESYWADMDRMKQDVRLTDFEVRDIEFYHHDRMARVRVYCHYWRLESPILRAVTVVQTWRYSQGGKEGMWKVSDYGFEAITRPSSVQ